MGEEGPHLLRCRPPHRARPGKVRRKWAEGARLAADSQPQGVGGGRGEGRCGAGPEWEWDSWSRCE